MGRLIDMLKHKCENCNRVALPRTISGKYVSGETARMFILRLH